MKIKLFIWFLTWLIVLTWALAAMTQELYPLPGQQGALLGELKKDCYGPAASCDGTGRPFHWRPEGTQDGPNVVIEPAPHAYGFGRSSSQFGTPIEPSLEQNRSSRGHNRSLGFGFGKNQDTQ